MKLILKKLFRENIGLKLLSLALALMVWLMVVNISKPEIIDSRMVRLEVKNEDVLASQGKTWSIEGKDSVSISYRVRMDQKMRIKSSDFQAYIDLADYSITGAVPVYVQVLNDKASLIEDVSARPQVIHIKTEDIQRKKFDLQVKVLNRTEVGAGYKVGSVLVSPEQIYATGPESEIGKISSIGIEIDVKGLEQNKDDVATPKFYDANGKEIVGMDKLVSLSVAQIQYTVSLHKLKELHLIPHLVGEPATDYVLSGTEINPQTMVVSAAASVIDELSGIDLPMVNISNMSASQSFSFDISSLLPAGVSLAQPGTQAELTVNISYAPPETEESTPAESQEIGPGIGLESESREAPEPDAEDEEAPETEQVSAEIPDAQTDSDKSSEAAP